MILNASFYQSILISFTNITNIMCKKRIRYYITINKKYNISTLYKVTQKLPLAIFEDIHSFNKLKILILLLEFSQKLSNFQFSQKCLVKENLSQLLINVYKFDY